jgi:hypothetical protein
VWPTDRWLNVELKAGGAAVARETVRVLAGRPGVVLSSFDPRMLLAARAAGSAYEHALLLAAESPAFLHAGGAQAFGCTGVHLDHRLCTEATIRRYRDQGLHGRGVDGQQPARKQTVAAGASTGSSPTACEGKRGSMSPWRAGRTSPGRSMTG